MEKQPDQHPINFYRKNQPYGEFSNFYPSNFEQNGVIYPTNQHYFQSKKFEGSAFEKEIANAPKPLDAFNMGQSRNHPLRQDWNQVKQTIMYNGLKLKFGQNSKLKQKLLGTGDRKLIEHTSNDSYWGDGGKGGKGKNRLGIILMQLRDQLKKQQVK